MGGRVRRGRLAPWCALALALLCACAAPPPPPPAFPPSALRLDGRPLEGAVRAAAVRMSGDRQALLVEVNGAELDAHLVLLGPEPDGAFRYRRPPELPAGEPSESWLRLGEKTLEAQELRAVPDGDGLRLEGTVRGDGRTLPLEGRIRVRKR